MTPGARRGPVATSPLPMPSAPERHYRWQWDLRAAPAALWPLVSNTDRFNRDCGLPPVEPAPAAAGPPVPPDSRRLRTRVMGVLIEWDERPFEWIAPHRFGVERVYRHGPVAAMRIQCDLAPRAGGGTSLTYETWITPAGLLGRLAVPVRIGWQTREQFGRVFRRYDELACAGEAVSVLQPPVDLVPGARERLAAIRRQLTDAAGQPPELVARLVDHVTAADDLSVARLRPYELADRWRAPRRALLPLCLHATRAGLLDFRWELLCPLCRGAKAVNSSLSAISPQVHCDACGVDFTASFDQSVELVFTPNPAIRVVALAEYCVGGPQVTPHVVLQQQLAAGETRTLALALEPGRYRLRAPQAGRVQRVFRVAPGAAAEGRIDLEAAARPEFDVAPAATLRVANAAGTPARILIERLAWTDQAATAAEVTALQLFRDLFASEVLRHGEQISVGRLAVVFTDLKGSTRLYQEIGDAPAFGRVLTHFEILRAAVAAEGGAVVKTMGDAIMAVFPRPVAALRAIAAAQQRLAQPAPAGADDPAALPAPLQLKAGLHFGPCIAINQNDRLDYFGTTVNIAARLCGLCHGGDLVLSAALRGDPEVAAALAGTPGAFGATAERVTLRGFGDEQFEVWRVVRASGGPGAAGVTPPPAP